MELIENPFIEFARDQAFAYNPFAGTGDGIEFFRDGEGEAARVLACLTVPARYAGMPRILHGGAAATFLDEVMFWSVVSLAGRLAFTIALDIHFWRYVPVGEAIGLEGRILSHDEAGRRLVVQGRLTLADGTLAAEARGTFLYTTREKLCAIFDLAEPPPSLLRYVPA